MNPVVRSLVVDIISKQRSHSAKIRVVLGDEQLRQALSPSGSNALNEVATAFDENAAHLSHGLSGQYEDGEISSPLREAMGEFAGMASGAQKLGSRHPATASVAKVNDDLSTIIGAYVVAHSGAMSAGNSLLTEICLRHLDRLKSLADRILSLLPKIVVREFAEVYDGFSGQVANPAADHVAEILD